MPIDDVSSFQHQLHPHYQNYPCLSWQTCRFFLAVHWEDLRPPASRQESNYQMGLQVAVASKRQVGLPTPR